MSAGFPSAEKLASLSRLSATINAAAAPPPLTEPVVLDDYGYVTVPVPHFEPAIVVDGCNQSESEQRQATHVRCQLHAGLTLQWAPVPERHGVLIDLRGGAPDGDPDRDAVTVFLTRDGLRAFVRDLGLIAASLDAA